MYLRTDTWEDDEDISSFSSYNVDIEPIYIERSDCEEFLDKLYSFLEENQFIDVNLKEFKSHFTDNDFNNKMKWNGNQSELIFLFDGLKIKEGNQYKTLVGHFLNKEGKPLNEKQLATTFQKMSTNQPKISGILSKLNHYKTYSCK